MASVQWHTYALPFILWTLLCALVGCGNVKESTPAQQHDSSSLLSSDPDWSEHAKLPPVGHRANIYNIEDPEEWQKLVEAGKRHLLGYPVGPTGILIPQRLVREVMKWWVVRKVSGFENIEEFYDWLGLQPYPENDPSIPQPDNADETRMGISLRYTENGDEAVTFGCAACHSGKLFGKTVLGMSNRFPRANEAFVKVHNMNGLVNRAVLDAVTHATPDELTMMQNIKETFKWVGVKKPAELGLDTSLAQVGISLGKRELDPYATKSKESAKHPRKSPLEDMITDSKPAVWWNIKYKTKFLSDASVVAGNPIYTNFLWNEIGRGADLRELETWLNDNPHIIKEVTAAAFATEAPSYTDFFPAESIDLPAAQRGEILFAENCARCHGSYQKGWSQPEAQALPLAEQLKTIEVRYPEQTFVVDVGTDPLRAEGMKHFADRLNELAISKSIGTTVTPQFGYVPPPLVAIWARWPYFHNNSAPSLCTVLTRTEQRPLSYYIGEPVHRETDFDQECNGYPMGEATPKAWRKKEFLFNADKPGLRNTGHDEGIFLKNGEEIFSNTDKRDLIQFLKTL